MKKLNKSIILLIDTTQTPQYIFYNYIKKNESKVVNFFWMELMNAYPNVDLKILKIT